MKYALRNLASQLSQPGAISWLLFLAGLPFLAQTPLLNDGPEVVSTALTGGTLHPPGFPLQSGVDQIVVWLPFSSPSYRLAMVSYAAHCGAAYFFFRILLHLSLGTLWRFLLGATFFVGGPLLFLGTQPEVFAPSHFMIMASATLWFHFVQGSDKPVHPMLGIQTSLLIGLSALTHPITVLALPFWVGLGLKVVRDRTSYHDLLFLFFPGFLIWGFGYSTLMLPHQGFWPHWGGITTFSEVMDHFLRSEYGTFSLQEDQIGEPHNALSLLFFHNAAWGLGLYLSMAMVFVILPFLPRGWTYKGYAPVNFAFVLSMGFAAMASTYGDNETANCVAYRFTAIPWMFTLIGAACFLTSAELKPMRNKILGWLAFLQLGVMVYHEVPNLLAMRDNTFHLFHQRIQDSLAPDDLYISHSDIEAFLSTAEHPMETLFPLEHSLYPKAWYREQLTQLRPYLFGTMKEWPDTAGELYVQQWRSGHTLKATQEHLVAIPQTTPLLDGLLFQTLPPNAQGPTDLQRVKNHLSLCDDIIQMGPVPGSPFTEDNYSYLRTRRFAFVHGLRYFYLRAFADAYELALSLELPIALNENLQMVIESLQAGQDAEVWVNACKQLQNTPHLFSSPRSDGT